MVTTFFSDNFPDFYFRCSVVFRWSKLFDFASYTWLLFWQRTDAKPYKTKPKSQLLSSCCSRTTKCLMIDERYQISNTVRKNGNKVVNKKVVQRSCRVFTPAPNFTKSPTDVKILTPFLSLSSEISHNSLFNCVLGHFRNKVNKNPKLVTLTPST